MREHEWEQRYSGSEGKSEKLPLGWCWMNDCRSQVKLYEEEKAGVREVGETKGEWCKRSECVKYIVVKGNYYRFKDEVKVRESREKCLWVDGWLRATSWSWVEKGREGERIGGWDEWSDCLDLMWWWIRRVKSMGRHSIFGVLLMKMREGFGSTVLC